MQSKLLNSYPFSLGQALCFSCFCFPVWGSGGWIQDVTCKAGVLHLSQVPAPLMWHPLEMLSQWAEFTFASPFLLLSLKYQRLCVWLRWHTLVSLHTMLLSHLGKLGHVKTCEVMWGHAKGQILLHTCKEEGWKLSHIPGIEFFSIV